VYFYNYSITNFTCFVILKTENINWYNNYQKTKDSCEYSLFNFFVFFFLVFLTQIPLHVLSLIVLDFKILRSQLRIKITSNRVPGLKKASPKWCCSSERILSKAVINELAKNRCFIPFFRSFSFSDEWPVYMRVCLFCLNHFK